MKKIIFFIFFCYLIGFSLHSSELTVFFYNPDAAAVDVSLLIKNAVAYFQKINAPIKFQPVLTPEIFQDVYSKKQAKIFIISSFMAKDLNDVKEILKPVNEEDKTTFKKVILVKEGGINAAAELKTENMASTSSGPNSLKYLNEFLFTPSGFDGSGAKIIWVKKDLDAVLAAKFGQVKAAIIAEKNIEKIKKINPVAVTGLKSLSSSKDIDESPLCVTNDVNNNDIETIKKAFLDMHNSNEGKEFLSSLGYKKWITK